MALIPNSDLKFVLAVSQLSYTNPFLQDRIDLEQAALGDDFVSEPHGYWSFTEEQITQRRSNLGQITDKARLIAEDLRRKLLEGVSASEVELQLYDDLVLYVLFYVLLEHWRKLGLLISGNDARDLNAWKQYSEQFDYWLNLPMKQLPSASQKVHLFAVFHQVYRAFYNIFECVIGQSLPAAKLRAAIWQSIFTHDLRRFRRSLYRTLHHVTTLVTGPSGSGKELVARAIAMSRYIPFDPKQGKFATDPTTSYFAINISAFSKGLVESELFGHAKGAFTGAAGSRAGWLEACGEHGVVLLDEIGELDPATQVKLLRVLQNRQYQRLGETRMREFQGKIIAATNRDLRREIESGTFREDLYYRLCSDVIETPSLASQVQDNPKVLGNLIAHIAGWIAPEERETLTREVIDWLSGNLPPDYHWPGNIRELEQCLRNIMIHGHYEPSSVVSASGAAGTSTYAKKKAEVLLDQMQSLQLTADELLCQYCKMAYQKTRSFEKAARLLQLDRRTVRAKVDLASESEGV